MKIAVLMCVHNDLELSAAALRYLAHVKHILSDEMEIEAMVVGDQGSATRNIATESGWHYLHHENNPVGKKFNAGLLALRGKEPDAVLVLGSDNFANPALFRRWAKSLEAGKGYIGFLDATILHLGSMRLIRWHGYPMGRREGEVMGSGRCFSRAILDRVEWSLWDDTLDRNLDWSTTVRLKDFGIKPNSFRQGAEGIAHLGVKTSSAITSFQKYVRDPRMFTDLKCPDDLDRMFGATLFEDLYAIAGVLR